MRWWTAVACAMALGAGLGWLSNVVAPHPVSAEGPYAISISLQLRSTSCTKTLAQSPNVVSSLSADGASGTYSVCIYVENTSTGLPIDGAPVEVRTLVGTVGVSGTARYSGYLFTTGGGVTSISYRGDGKTFGGDTIVAYYGGTRAIATATVLLTPAAGRYPTKIAITEPDSKLVAIGSRDSTSLYASPAVGSNLAVQVQDANGLGVNNQVVLVRSEQAKLVANPAMALTTSAACAGATSQALALTTAGTNVLVATGITMPGTLNFTVCADPDRQPGEITVTVEAVSTQLPLATLTLRQVGRPTAIGGQFDGVTLSTTVTDAAGLPVVDGTPVRIALPATAGAVSSSCVTTRNGRASVVVALDVPLAAIALSTEYNERGTAASCLAPGNRFIAIAVPVGGVPQQ